MSVYIDDATNALGRMKMSHMMADTLSELHTMAARIGLRREWFQDNPDHPHYDLCQSKRRLAVARGAIEIDGRQLVALVRKQRAERETPEIDRRDEHRAPFFGDYWPPSGEKDGEG